MENPLSDFDARFDLAIVKLLYIQKRAQDYKEGAAKELVITVTNMIAPVDNDLAQEIRRKLAFILAE